MIDEESVASSAVIVEEIQQVNIEANQQEEVVMEVEEPLKFSTSQQPKNIKKDYRSPLRLQKPKLDEYALDNGHVAYFCSQTPDSVIGAFIRAAKNNTLDAPSTERYCMTSM